MVTKDKNGKLIVSTKTISKRFAPAMNRKARRSLLNTDRYVKMARRIASLLSLMEGYEGPKRGKKYLTGYYSQLLITAKSL